MYKSFRDEIESDPEKLAVARDFAQYWNKIKNDVAATQFAMPAENSSLYV